MKLELLVHLYSIGRAKAIERATSDLHWKYFLGLPISANLPDQSTLCVFRKRLGAEGFKDIFDALIGVARDEGLISDRLRLKDATHIYGDVAIPTSLGLFASLRDRMLASIRRYDSDAADVFESEIEAVRERTAASTAEERLAARVSLVEDLLAWIIEQPACDDPSPSERIRQQHWQSMQSI